MESTSYICILFHVSFGNWNRHNVVNIFLICWNTRIVKWFAFSADINQFISFVIIAISMEITHGKSKPKWCTNKKGILLIEPSVRGCKWLNSLFSLIFIDAWRQKTRSLIVCSVESVVLRLYPIKMLYKYSTGQLVEFINGEESSPIWQNAQVGTLPPLKRAPSCNGQTHQISDFILTMDLYFLN